MYIYTFVLRTVDNMTSQNIDHYSWDTLYIYIYIYVCVCVCLVSASTVGPILFVFNIQEFI
jgi:hypothetical protein